MLRNLVAVVLLVVASAAGGAVPARAATTAPLGLGDCRVAAAVRLCQGLVPTWDGVPLDTTVGLPAGADPGMPLPLIVTTHGFGNSKNEFLDPAQTAYTDNVQAWVRAGYAVLDFTARGLWGSCGTPEARAASPAACARGNLHLADVRYEVRDTQELVGRLVDEGVADARRLGATGDSYGGGQTLMLAALRDRMVLPDGTLVPWRSPRGTPLRLAAAAPVIPWSQLVATIAPNGRALLGQPVSDAELISPVGVFKPSIANAILAAAQNATGPGQPVGQPFVPGRPMGYIAPAGADPEADVFGWVARSDLGEPYDDASARATIDTLTRFHSAYAIDHSVPPVPLFVGSGFTDDLFPVDETLRFTERTAREHPSVPVSVLLGDFGHQRASNKADVRRLLLSRVHGWMDYYVRGIGAAPPTGVTAMTQTCPRDRPSEGPFHAATAGGLANEHVRFTTVTAQTVSSAGGSPAASLAVDPVTGGGDGCAQVPADPGQRTALYDLPAATGAGTLLLGAPRVTARLVVRGAAPSTAQLQAHLWDVAPGGATQRLVARGTLRPTGGAQDVFELHATGWRFEAGHVPRLELLGQDAPFGRPSNGTFTVEVRSLSLDLPVRGPVLRCASRRHVVVHLRLRRGERLRRASVRILPRPSRRAAVVGRDGVRIVLDGLPRGRRTVVVRGTTSRGRGVRVVRRYRTCTAAYPVSQIAPSRTSTG
jgi:dienelactone hydrolase